MSPDLTGSNVLFRLKKIHTWSEAEVYQHLGTPPTAEVQSISDAALGPHVPGKLVESIKYPDIANERLTSSIRISDFGQSLFQYNLPTLIAGTLVAYCAPETLFG